MLSTLRQDLARISEPTVLNGLRCYFLPRGECFPYVFWLRVLQAVRRHLAAKILFGFVTYIIYRHFEFKYGIHANANVEIGGGFRPVHGPCNLNAAKIGRNFTVYSGVTIGINKGGIPTVGDNVSIFPNAVVCGPIAIGNNVTIGAISYVSRDLPDGAKFHSSTSTLNFNSK